MRGRVEEGRRIGDTLVEEGRAVRIRRGGKTPLEAALVSKRSSSHVSERGKRARKSQRERKRELGEARRIEVVGSTPVDGGDERRSRRRKRRSRWRVGEK